MSTLSVAFAVGFFAIVAVPAAAARQDVTLKQDLTTMRRHVAGRASVAHARADIKRDEALLRRHRAQGDEKRAQRDERNVQRDYAKLRRAQLAAERDRR